MISALSLLTFSVLVTCASATVVVTVNKTESHSIPPLLYGQMFEDIDSGDGGLYAELLQNRAFQQVTPNTTGALYAWNALNGAMVGVIADPYPVSSALPNSLQLTIPADSSGQVGFGNSGYHGIKVNSKWTYNVSFYYKFPLASSFDGSATVALQSSTGQTFASASVPINGSQTTWHQITLHLTPSTSPKSTANNFTVSFDGAHAAGQTINFAMFSLFPPTFKKRENGMRIDLATVREGPTNVFRYDDSGTNGESITRTSQTLHEMKPSFFRLPGGNNLEVDQPQRDHCRVGDWGYINTDGLGLLEYMYFCEDLKMEPIMAVWSGYSFAEGSVPEDKLAPYIQAAMDQINFVIGDPTTNEHAALRASLGHPEPFTLKYVEIGNEDFLYSNANESYYHYRWRDFMRNLTTAFPQLQFIATTLPFNPVLDPVPKQYDIHNYETAEWFVENAFMFDSYQRDGTSYFQGEYSAFLEGSKYPPFQGSLGEAAYMTGFERNGDIVFATAYSALLVNIAFNNPPCNQLVGFDAANIYPSSSYYVQQLFSIHRGSEYLPSTLPTVNGTLYWSVTRSTKLGVVYIKVVNTGGSPAPMTFELPFKVASKGNLTLVTAAPAASNSPENPDAVFPTFSSIPVAQALDYTAPAYSVSALTASVI